MAKKVPEIVAKEVKEIVFREADHANFLSQSRTVNKQFLNQLVAMENVGMKLAQYIPKAEVRTYIKDAILNRYAKDKAVEQRPTDFREIIKSITGLECEPIESDSVYHTQLFKSGDNVVVVAEGTVLKWETALRKALLYIAAKPFSQSSKSNIYIVLALFARHQKVSDSDVNQIKKALARCDAYLHVFGDA